MYLKFTIGMFDRTGRTEEEIKRDMIETVKEILNSETEEELFSYITVLEHLLEG